MSAGIARARLAEERKSWRKDRPIGFYAKPVTNPDNSMNLLEWECGIPGPKGTDWEGGVYKIAMVFTEDYPSKPPVCYFESPIFHPNVFTDGAICLSIINEEYGWRPSINMKQILLGIQSLLDSPNPDSPAQEDANWLFLNNRPEYIRRVRLEAKKHALQE